MLGEGRLFKVALALNLAVRSSRLGPAFARFTYGLWEKMWDVFFFFRKLVLGNAAKFVVVGMPVVLDLRDRSVTRALYLFREYEPLETEILVRNLRPGMNFVDIGANIGYYTVLAAKAVGETGTVIAFEPSSGNTEILRKNVALNDLRNVEIEESAVSDRNGELALYLCSINAGDHRIYDGKDDDFYNAGRVRKRVIAKAVALDSYFSKINMGVNMIKMDVQGAEYLALRGMTRTIVDNRDLLLMFEYWPHGLRRCGAHPMDLLTELEGLGLRIYNPAGIRGLDESSPAEIYASVQGVDSRTLFCSRGELSGSV